MAKTTSPMWLSARSVRQVGQKWRLKSSAETPANSAVFAAALAVLYAAPMPSLYRGEVPQSPTNTRRSATGCTALDTLIFGEQWQKSAGRRQFGGRQRFSSGDSSS